MKYHLKTISYVSFGGFAAAMFLAGCAYLQPHPLTSEEIANQNALDRQTAQAHVEPLTSSLTLQEAIARALKYNLDGRLRQMEVALTSNEYEASKFDMMPKVLANAGYHDRSNDLVTRSTDYYTGQPALSNPYISSEREHVTSDLTFTWSLLDFGLSYFNTKQNADRSLIAGERARRTTHLLIKDVRSAFWRTVSAQKLRGDVQKTIREAEAALKNSRQIEQEELRSPLDSLRYQRQLLENLRLLEAIDQELSTAQVELAKLTNLPLGVPFTVVEPANPQARPAIFQQPMENLEETALMNNADLREEFYNARIARDESKKIITKLFPGVSFSYGRNHDTDDYLINHTWNQAGAQISFNLMNIFAYPSYQAMADAGVAVADQRRVTQQMAVLAQVHVAKLEYENSWRQFNRADAIWNVDNRIAQHIRNQSDAEKATELERVANNTTAILSMLRRYQALAQAHTATSQLQATLGLEPTLSNIDNTSLPDLTKEVQQSLENWQAGKDTQGIAP